jgi:hypothetical protein
MGGTTLDGQLQKAGVPFEVIPVEHLVGVNARAELILYTSPKTGLPVAVLCIIDRYEIDVFAITYLYRDNTTREFALRKENYWHDFYFQAMEFLRSFGRQQAPQT